VWLLSRKFANFLSPLASIMKKLLILSFASFTLLFPSFSFADVPCYATCDSGAYRDIFADGTVCGAGLANSFPLDSEPMCLEYTKPVCSDQMPWMCDTEDACSNLSTWGFGTYWTGYNCIVTDGRFWYSGSDYEGTFSSTDETFFWDDTSANFSRNHALLQQIISILRFFLPLIVIFQFVTVFVTMVRFIRSFFHSKDDSL